MRLSYIVICYLHGEYEYFPFNGMLMKPTGKCTLKLTLQVNFPPFVPAAYWPIFERTLCFDAKHFAGPHAIWHNRYGYLQSAATYQVWPR